MHFYERIMFLTVTDHYSMLFAHHQVDNDNDNPFSMPNVKVIVPDLIFSFSSWQPSYMLIDSERTSKNRPLSPKKRNAFSCPRRNTTNIPPHRFREISAPDTILSIYLEYIQVFMVIYKNRHICTVLPVPAIISLSSLIYFTNRVQCL